MKNYEQYADEIREYEDEAFCNDFVKPHILGRDSCSGVGCVRCCMFQMIWLLEEYEEPEEPEVNWDKVEVDTPILVRYSKKATWKKRYFAKYENNKVYAWDAGATSWSAKTITDWRYAKLIENNIEEDQE